MNLDDQADERFFESFDPFHFAHCALAIEAARRQRPDLRACDTSTQIEIPHPITSHFQRSSARSLEIHLHLLRLQQSEVLLCLMASNHLKVSYARFIALTRYDELNIMLEDIAARRVPYNLGLFSSGIPLEFDQWVEAKLFGQFSVVENDRLPKEIIDYVCDEAEACKKRAIVNAYKHGCRLSATASNMVISDAEGQSIVELSIERGVRWLKWSEDKEFAYLAVGTQELDPDTDFSRIWYGGILLKAMCDLRVAKMKRRVDDVSVSLPKPLERGRRPQSHVVTMKAGLAPRPLKSAST
jgi:hypothetical protein